MSRKSTLNIIAGVDIGLNCLALCKNLYSYTNNSKAFRAGCEEFNINRSKYLCNEAFERNHPGFRDKMKNLQNKLYGIRLGSIGHCASTALAATTLCINNLTKSKVAPLITLGLSVTMLLASVGVEKDTILHLKQ